LGCFFWKKRGFFWKKRGFFCKKNIVFLPKKHGFGPQPVVLVKFLRSAALHFAACKAGQDCGHTGKPIIDLRFVLYFLGHALL